MKMACRLQMIWKRDLGSSAVPRRLFNLLSYYPEYKARCYFPVVASQKAEFSLSSALGNRCEGDWYPSLPALHTSNKSIHVR
jgi:hypothetical protein